MNQKQHLQLLGYISKEVKLASFKHTETYNEMVLEARDLFSGYYNAPAYESGIVPRHLYFIIKPFDDIHNMRVIRATQKVKKELAVDFDASPGQLKLFNKPAQFIRVRISDFSNIKDLIEAYKKAGVVFVKDQEVKEYTTKIKILNYFDLVMEEENIYRNADNPALFYLIMDGELSWESFNKFNQKVVNNFIDDRFDGAPGYYYAKTGIHDFIRIYANKDFPVTKLRMIHKMYQEELDLLQK